MVAFVNTVEENISRKWLNVPGFKSRRSLIGLWMLTGFVLSMAYKSCLLTSLITVRYERPVDTVDELLESGREFLSAEGIISTYVMVTHPAKR